MSVAVLPTCALARPSMVDEIAAPHVKVMPLAALTKKKGGDLLPRTSVSISTANTMGGTRGIKVMDF